MDYNIEQLPTQQIVFMRRTGAYGIENYALMATLKEWAKCNGLFEDSIIYGIAQDNASDTPPEQCRYDVCLIKSVNYTVDETVQHGEIHGGKYAVFTIPHTAEAVQDFWSSVVKILQDSNLQYDSAKPIMERYKHRLVEDGFCEFCVPIF
jgi:DNA gyrase inhibitor GyrI